MRKSPEVAIVPMNTRTLSSAAREETFAEKRMQMVLRQLRQRGIRDERTLAAMGEVQRELFVPPTYRELSYADQPLPLSGGQTISQPYTVAFMCEALQLMGHEKVLEVGTGSGYGAAVLSRLAREVHSVERLSKLAQKSQATLSRLGYDNVRVHLANGSLGLAEEAPFDAIIVTAAAESLPSAYLDQLCEGGRILIPIGPHRGCQELCRFTRRQGQLRQERLGGFCFVPLVTT